MRRTTTLAALLAALAVAGCKVQVEDKGKLPDVDVRNKDGGTPEVDVKPGRMPDVEVKGDSGIQMPDIKAPKIEAPKIEAPKIDAPEVDLPSPGRDTARRTNPR
ncbi:MAG TPA: hypothetical protein VF092_22610 [Longimicrobium sp.]